MSTTRLGRRVGAEALGGAGGCLAVLAGPIDALGVVAARLAASSTTLAADAKAAVRALRAIQVGVALLVALVAALDALAQDALLARSTQALRVVGAWHTAISRADATEADHAVVVGHLVAIDVGLARATAQMHGGVAAISLVAELAVGVAAVTVGGAVTLAA